MGSFYPRLQATASRLLKSYGQLLTFTREVETGFTPSTGTKTNDLFTFTGYGASFEYKTSEVDGAAVQTGDIKLIVEKMTKTPLINDRVRIDNVNYRVMDVKKTSPGGVDVVYTCNLRR